MSGISSGVGLISGIPIADLVDQLMQIEARPLEAVKNRITGIETEKTAWLSLSASLLSAKLAASAFEDEDTFLGAKTTSSNPSVMTATAKAGASLGTYQFTVRRLVQTHQLIGTGFADSDTTSVGAGTLTFDLGRGQVNASTKLDFLNGQAGVRRGSIRITDRAGVTADVDLTDAMTVTDLLETINNEANLGVSARVVGDTIVLNDTTGLGGTITVADIGNGNTAADLGIAGSATDAPLVGADINYISTSTSLDLLNDGNGIERSGVAPDLEITLRDATTLSVRLSGTVGLDDYTALSVGDVIDAINDHVDNGGKLVASISDDGNGIKLIDTTGGGGNLVIADGVGSLAATQLRIAGTYTGGAGNLTANGLSVVAGLDSVLVSNLAGGGGLTLGTLDLQDRDGNTTTVDLSSATSLSDIVEAINNNGAVSVQASVNEAGNGLTITDTTASTDFNLIVADGGGGNVAATLGIVVDGAVDEVVGSNAQHRYVSTQTKLSELSPGETWAGGSFRITNSDGAYVTVNVSASNVERVEDVIRNINSAAQVTLGVTARVNDSGTGIILEDSTAGGELLTVEDLSGGRSASILGLAGQANTGEAFIDGSFHHAITIDADDTLQDVVDKINDADMNVRAGVINDGSGVNPYRLILSSDVSGTAGEIVFDAGQSGLSMMTFVEARDALVYLGSPGGANSLALTSDTNQLTGVISGVTLDLNGTDTNPVSVTISRDTESLAKRMESFVGSFNSVIDNIDEYTKFNPETLERGVLFGNGTVSLVRSRLMNMIINSVDVAGSYTRLSQVGVSIRTGNKLNFDQDKFLETYATSPTDIITLFTQAAETEEVVVGGETKEQDVAGTGGIGAVFESMLDQVTRDYDGVIARVTNGLDGQTRLLNNRVDQLDTILAGKRARLESKFTAMEMALARLQGQQSALTGLSQLAASFSVSGSGSSG